MRPGHPHLHYRQRTFYRTCLPLQTSICVRRESAAAASAKSGVEHGLNNIVGRHLKKYLCKRKVTVHCDILVDLLGVDDAAVTKRNSLLLLIESGIRERSLDILVFGTVCLLVINEAVHYTSLQKMLADYFGNIVYCDTAVKSAFGINYHYRTERTKSETTGLNYLDLLGKTVCLKLLCERFAQCGASGRSTAGTSANKYM